MKTATDKQHEVYIFIVEFRKERGYSPTNREISDHFGFASQTSAVNHVRALAKKGLVRLNESVARSVVPTEQQSDCEHMRVGKNVVTMSGEIIPGPIVFTYCPWCGAELDKSKANLEDA